MAKYILACCVAVLFLFYYPKLENQRHIGEERVHVMETTNSEECATMGGHVQNVCALAEKVCLIDYKDAGKPCQSSTECEGKCIYTADKPANVGDSVMGFCEADNNPCGCWQLVEKGELHAEVCAE